jgi:rare lipoprotein A
MKDKTAVVRFIAFALLLCTSFPAFPAEFGIASWYGEKFHGRRTSNGEIFDMRKLTCAHKSLPFGTILLVTNLDNDKSVLVKVNDRGPFVRGRIIDLSKAAAIEIGLLKTGTARVKIEILGKNQNIIGISNVSIQVASFRDESNAKKMQEKLSAAGFSSIFEHASGSIIRVIIPDIGSSRISGTLRDLELIGITNPIIIKGHT